MKIALVDDQIADLKNAEAFLSKYIAQNFSEASKDIRIDSFANVENFLRAFEPGKYDLFILDIFMKPLNGIQVAQIIRNKDRDAFIIFLTSSEDYILEGYKVFAVGYFIKPLAKNIEQFAKTFDYIFPKLCAGQKKISVRVNGVEISIPCKTIRYVDIGERHGVCIHLLDKKISPANTYEEIFSALESDPRFVECYHRILLNMDFIKFMDGNDFILSDGSKIPISQRKCKTVKLKYMSHLIGANSSNTSSL